MTEKLQTTQTFVAVEDGYRIWTESIGGGAINQRPALLVLHGGPGIGSEYLKGLSALASPRQRVVFYDQLGCGRSDRPVDFTGQTRWVMPRFVREIETVRKALLLEKIVLLGQSWGGMLAIEYLLTRPEGVKGAILSNALASAPLWSQELNRLKDDLPPVHLAAIRVGQATGDISQAACQEAVHAFYRRHVLRLDPFPEAITQALESPNPVYAAMWGDNEFSVTGNLKDWDRIADLHEIKVPIQLISGQFDESTPAQNEAMLRELSNANWELMPGCSHLAHLESPDEYLAIVQTFLTKVSSVDH